MASRGKKKRNRSSRHEDRRFTIRSVRRDPPDIRKLSNALIGLAVAEAERQAQAEQAARDAKSEDTSNGDVSPGGTRDA